MVRILRTLKLLSIIGATIIFAFPAEQPETLLDQVDNINAEIDGKDSSVALVRNPRFLFVKLWLLGNSLLNSQQSFNVIKQLNINTINTTTAKPSSITDHLAEELTLEEAYGDQSTTKKSKTNEKTTEGSLPSTTSTPLSERKSSENILNTRIDIDQENTIEEKKRTESEDDDNSLATKAENLSKESEFVPIGASGYAHTNPIDSESFDSIFLPEEVKSRFDLEETVKETQLILGDDVDEDQQQHTEPTVVINGNIQDKVSDYATDQQVVITTDSINDDDVGITSFSDEEKLSSTTDSISALISITDNEDTSLGMDHENSTLEVENENSTVAGENDYTTVETEDESSTSSSPTDHSKSDDTVIETIENTNNSSDLEYNVNPGIAKRNISVLDAATGVGENFDNWRRLHYEINEYFTR